VKILIVGVEQIKKDERYMDDKGWSFKRAFDKNGIETELFIYKKKGELAFLEKKKYVRDVWRHYMNRQLFACVKKSKPDVLFVITGNTIEPETLWKIRNQTATTLVNVFTDNPFVFMKRFGSIEAYHYFFVKDTYILTTLKKAGLNNVFYLPQCTNPEIHKPMTLTGGDESVYCTDVALIGSMYPYRAKAIEQLVEFKPAIWGRGWSDSSNPEVKKLYRGKDIRGTQKAKAISGAAISLNPHHPLNDINGTGSRTFDIAACRGFQLADYKSDIEKLLKIGEEIICYKTIDELKKLIDYYLKHSDERAEIAEAGYRRVMKDHTYDVRAKQILEIISGRR
jgi:spore maturation protein CgeB